MFAVIHHKNINNYGMENLFLASVVLPYKTNSWAKDRRKFPFLSRGLLKKK